QGARPGKKEGWSPLEHPAMLTEQEFGRFKPCYQLNDGTPVIRLPEVILAGPRHEFNADSGRLPDRICLYSFQGQPVGFTGLALVDWEPPVKADFPPALRQIF